MSSESNPSRILISQLLSQERLRDPNTFADMVTLFFLLLSFAAVPLWFYVGLDQAQSAAGRDFGEKMGLFLAYVAILPLGSFPYAIAFVIELLRNRWYPWLTGVFFVFYVFIWACYLVLPAEAILGSMKFFKWLSGAN